MAVPSALSMLSRQHRWQFPQHCRCCPDNTSGSSLSTVDVVQTTQVAVPSALLVLSKHNRWQFPQHCRRCLKSNSTGGNSFSTVGVVQTAQVTVPSALLMLSKARQLRWQFTQHFRCSPDSTGGSSLSTVDVVSWFLPAPATCEHVNGSGLLRRQLCVPPHSDECCGSKVPSDPVPAVSHLPSPYWH